MKQKISYVIIGILIVFRCHAQDNSIDKLKPAISGLPKIGLAEAGMSPDTISKMIDLINTNPPNDFRGMVVVKNNNLVVEEYFNTYWRETIHDIRSAGKGVTALLLGIAIDQGLIKDVEQNVFDFFSKTKLVDGHEAIKIKHLLSMSSGLDADDFAANSPGSAANWLNEKNWVEFANALPMVFTPGQKYVYNDICPMLIGAMIEKTSGQKLADFANVNLFKPLGIREVYWYTAPNGSTGPMGNLYISALDFAKIGLLVLNNGTWAGKQIVSPKWTAELTTKRFDISKSDPFAKAYGYFWFLGEKEVNGKLYKYAYASGNGGNLVFVVPEEHLVVSLISSGYGQGYGHQRSHNIFTYILKSIIIK